VIETSKAYGVDRSRCAWPVLRVGVAVPCGHASEVASNEPPWAYCRKHGDDEANRLGIVIERHLAQGDSAVGERVKRETLLAELGAAT
jgi:hypothetical protein